MADAISLLDGLSEEQRAAVTSKKPYVRVIAGAGAGKTETLTRRVAYLLLVERVEPSSIVAFTFTEKAALSMKSRIYRYISGLNGPTSRLGEMYVGTIHSYAKRLLDDHPKYGNYELIDENKEVAFLSNQGWDLFPGPGRIKRMAEFLRTFRMALDEMLSDKSLEAGAPAFFRLKAKYEAKLEQHRLLTFGTSIRLAVEVLRERPAAGVRYLFIDEYQDINRAQEEMIKLIGRGASVFVVGDPRQSIYQWRGSDERHFETFSETFAPSETVEISENRRSSQSVVKAANAFASGFAVKSSPMVATMGDEGISIKSSCIDIKIARRNTLLNTVDLSQINIRLNNINKKVTKSVSFTPSEVEFYFNENLLAPTLSCLEVHDKPYSINPDNYDLINKLNIYAYDESVQNFNALEGELLFFSSAVVKIEEKYTFSLIVLPYFLTSITKYKNIIDDVIIYSETPSEAKNRILAYNKIQAVIENVEPHSLIFIDGPLLGGNVNASMVDMDEKLRSIECIPIYFTKNSDSRLIIDKIPELASEYNTDFHWASRILKPQQRTPFFKYTDGYNQRFSKVFTYIKVLSGFPERVEMHSDTFEKYDGLINDIMDLIAYFYLIQGDYSNPQVRPIAIAEKYAREGLNILKIPALLGSLGFQPTINQIRFG